MIQRIQTVYFTIALLLTVLFLVSPIFRVDNPDAGDSITFSLIDYDESRGKEGKTIGIRTVWGGDLARMSDFFEKGGALAFTVTGILALGASVLLYRKRQMQIKISWVAFGILLILSISSWIFALTMRTFGFERNILMSYGLFIMPLAAILTFLGNRAVKKDDELVKSADRIR